MPAPVDFDQLWFRAVPALLNGPVSAAALSSSLRVSQPTLSRLFAKHRAEIFTLGRARTTQYVARRRIHDLRNTVPLFEIDEQGGSRVLASLHPVGHTSVFVESHCDDVDSRLHPGLPYFLDGMRPSGFLGRLVPRRHPNLGLPREVRDWSNDHTLRYLALAGWNAVGSCIVGDQAFERYLEDAARPELAIDDDAWPSRYPQLASDVLAGAPPGSSAAGEQPKFLATRSPQRDVLVKFSPPTSDGVGRRIADLLIAEHIAHELLRERGFDAALSSVMEADGKVFLEVDRFDRTGVGRRGLLSLEALAVELSDDYGRAHWPFMVESLVDNGHVPASLLEPVRWLSAFGALIGNNDMHPGNLSFFARGARVIALAPVYDMLPMQYAPHQGHLVDRPLNPRAPNMSEASHWEDVCEAASLYWARVAEHALISRSFGPIARANVDTVDRVRRLARRLPR